MEREIIKIDEELCNGCGACIPNCHEGALQMIDNKARLVSDLLCDGLGACVGHCPVGAITIEKREAEPYDEVKVIKSMIPKGKNLILAHLKHLKDHGETGYMKQGMQYLKANRESLNFNLDEIINEMHKEKESNCHSGGCPGSAAVDLGSVRVAGLAPETDAPSELKNWPVQLHLINPAAGYFKGADLLIAADCTAFAMGAFHQKFIKGKALCIACPKLDNGQEIYFDKIIRLIEESQVNTITVAIMEVPCCRGLLQLVKTAADQAQRKVPVKVAVVGIEGGILSEQWV